MNENEEQEDDGKVEVKLFLRTGQTIEFRADKVVTKRNTFDGSLQEIEWFGAVGAPIYLDLSDVVAVQ